MWVWVFLLVIWCDFVIVLRAFYLFFNVELYLFCFNFEGFRVLGCGFADIWLF